MQQKMGYVLIVIGAALLVWGVLVVSNPKGGVSVEPEVETTMEKVAEVNEAVIAEVVDESEEVEEDNYAKGLAFEEFVVQRLNRKYFTVKEWRSDKEVEGVFAESNMYPDFEINFNLKSREIDIDFAVECKWRKGFYRNGLQWSTKSQIERYNEFARERKMPVWLVLGVGGEPNDPEEMYVAPLKELQKPRVSFDDLKLYRRRNPKANFFWDAEKGRLE